MAGLFVNVTSAASSSNGSSQAVAWPSTTLNDWVLLILNVGSTTAVLSDPSGFTALKNADASTTCRTKCWTHKCDGTESGNITASWSGVSTSSALLAIAYSGIGGFGNTAAADVSATNTSVTSGTSKTVSALTAVQNDQELAIWCDSQATSHQTWTIASVTPRGQVAATASQFVSIGVGDLSTPVGGGTSMAARAATTNVTSAAFVGYHIGLNPRVDGETNQFNSNSYSAQVVRLFGSVVPTVGQLWPRGAPV